MGGTAEMEAVDAGGMAALPAAAQRADGALFLVACGESLALGHAAVCSALVLFHRVNQAHKSSGAQLDAQIVAAACLLVVSKTCERPRMLRSVANAAHAHMNATLEPLGAGSRYRNLKTALINAEQSVLRALAFDVDVALPSSFLLSYARVFGFSRATAACALQLAGDALLDAATLVLPASALAAASLRLASLLTDDAGALPAPRKWWYDCDTSDEDVAAVAAILRRVHDTAAADAPPSQ